MSLLVKAGRDAGLDVQWLTYYAGGLGTPTAMGEAAAGKVRIIAEYHSNVANNKAAKWDADYRKQAPKSDPRYYYRPWKTILVRTVADGGESFYVQGDHRITVPHLHRAAVLALNAH
jgi:hypothetical protein